MTNEKIPLTEAMETLTIAEVRAIEKHYGVSMEDGLSGTCLTAGVAYAFEKRRALRESVSIPSWDEVENHSMKWLNDYFALPEQEAFIEGEPEGPSGKD
jgi:hypothetical protein